MRGRTAGSLIVGVVAGVVAAFGAASAVASHGGGAAPTPRSRAIDGPAPGARLWMRRNGNGYVDTPNAAAVSPDGTTVFVTGATGSLLLPASHPSDITTVAYDAVTGATRWLRRYDGPAHDYDDANALAVSPDGSRIFVTGWSEAPERIDRVTIAYDAATGARLWVARYEGPTNEDDGARALAVSPDGSRLFVTGEAGGPDPAPLDYLTVAYDTATGAQLWSARYNGPGGTDEGSGAIGVSGDGSRVFVNCDSDNDYATIAYAAR
jgi:DNA-binding beta-propeller fold protein YncE